MPLQIRTVNKSLLIVVSRRGYAEAASQKYSRAKPHMNIGTIGESMSPLR